MRHDETRVGGAAQETVEFRELAALPLPSHPAPFAGVPAPLAVKEKEARRSVALVQLIDQQPRMREQLVIPFLGCLVRVRKVSEQREMQVIVAVREEADLYVIDQRANFCDRIDNGGHDGDRSALTRDAVAEREFRQQPGRNR